MNSCLYETSLNSAGNQFFIMMGVWEEQGGDCAKSVGGLLLVENCVTTRIDYIQITAGLLPNLINPKQSRLQIHLATSNTALFSSDYYSF